MEKFDAIFKKIAVVNTAKPKTLSAVDGDFFMPYLFALRTKPFLLLAGISGTGKSRLVRELAFLSCPVDLQDADGTNPGNYCMIEVKPNWHDSTELLGYYSNINNKYIFKKFANFLVKAMRYPNVPFFVCLDEMNLAPVEHYFAEFLSVLETRKKVNDKIVSGPLIEARHFEVLRALSQTPDPESKDFLAIAEDAIKGFGISKENTEIIESLIANGLSLPDNVLIIGTVNMDDTTHQFSRKVIDRAMTIEMNGGKLNEMFGGAAKLQYNENPWRIDLFKAQYVSADEALYESALKSSDVEGIKNELVVKLDEINNCLANTPFQVSYRVLQELVIYLAVLADVKGIENIDVLINKAIDDIALMKILPRIEGDEETLEISKYNQPSRNFENKLQWLISILPVSATAVESSDSSGKELSEKAEKPIVATNAEVNEGRSQAKLREMDQRLKSVGFTRFWP
jgi:5-methylcytosine-specific restriction endonuclease McrBC GTP-binding regulatory subunit McrB